MFKIFRVLTVAERRQWMLITLASVFVAIFDVIGLASVMPFIAILSNPNVINDNQFLRILYEYLQFQDAESFLFFIGSLVFTLLIGGIALRAFSTYLHLKFVMKCQDKLSVRLLTKYLELPYVDFLNQNSSEILRRVLSDAESVFLSGMVPLGIIISQLVVVASLLSIIIYFDPLLALNLIAFFALSYGITILLVKQPISKAGKFANSANLARYKTVTEAFGAFKETKIFALGKVWVDRYSKHSRVYAKYKCRAQTIQQLPRSVLEALAFGSLLLVLLYFLRSKGGVLNALPYISFYALSAYRLMPALQQIYSNYVLIGYARPSIDLVYSDLVDLKIISLDHQSRESIQFRENLQVSNVSFKYPGSQAWSLKNINLNISAGRKIAFVGVTGSGKTTLVDLIMGLIEPQSGYLIVDQKKITKDKLNGWQKKVAYVPQQIYLLDDSISSNIAFGFDSDTLDMERVVKSAKVAKLHDFIVGELALGYESIVGERGIRLSGGQRQRIGIARALYRKSEVLVLDEATSALDNVTESDVMDAINQINGEITLIIVAHRLNTVKNCDEIYLLDRGEIVANGTFDELQTKSKLFRKMIDANNFESTT